MTADGSSGRESERIPLPATLQGEVLVFQRMDIRQLSVEGALIETAFQTTYGLELKDVFGALDLAIGT